MFPWRKQSCLEQFVGVVMAGSSGIASGNESGDIDFEDDLRALGDADSAREVEAAERIARRGRSAVPRLLAAISVDRLGGVGQARILRLLAECRAPEALPSIIVAIDDPRHIVREAAIDAVATFDDPSATAALVRLLGDPDSDVVKQASSRLGARRDVEALEALGRLLKRREQGVRYSAARALAAFAEPRARELLVAHLRDENDEEVRAVIAAG
jgi:HEAT repeat protein